MSVWLRLPCVCHLLPAGCREPAGRKAESALTGGNLCSHHLRAGPEVSIQERLSWANRQEASCCTSLSLHAPSRQQQGSSGIHLDTALDEQELAT